MYTMMPVKTGVNKVKTKKTDARLKALKKDKNLKWCLTASEAQIFTRFAEHYNVEGRFVYIDNHAPVLCVAHIDTVVELSRNPTLAKNGILTANGLDDRLGLWQMLYGFDRKVDILITTDEEKGQSTASEAQELVDIIDKYNWVMEFDRSGSDVVTYGHDSQEWLDSLVEHFEVGIGSFSDITYLDRLNVCKVNIGHGVENGHSRDVCHADIDVMFDNMDAMAKFYDEHYLTKFACDPKANTGWDDDDSWDTLYNKPITKCKDGLLVSEFENAVEEIDYDLFAFMMEQVRGFISEEYTISGLDLSNFDKPIREDIRFYLIESLEAKGYEVV